MRGIRSEDKRLKALAILEKRKQIAALEEQLLWFSAHSGPEILSSIQSEDFSSFGRRAYSAILSNVLCCDDSLQSSACFPEDFSDDHKPQLEFEFSKVTEEGLVHSAAATIEIAPSVAELPKYHVSPVTEIPTPTNPTTLFSLQHETWEHRPLLKRAATAVARPSEKATPVDAIASGFSNKKNVRNAISGLCLAGSQFVPLCCCAV